MLAWTIKLSYNLGMSLLDSLVGTIAPYECLACQKNGSPLCDYCFLSAGSPPPPRCAGCKKLSDKSRTCKSCQSWLGIKTITVATTLDGLEERLLHSYKFDLQRQGCTPISKLMSQMLIVSDFDVLTWVPTAPARIRMRGFDHARLLAEQLSRNQGKLRAKPLLLRQTNVRQLGSTRQERIRQMEGEFVPMNANLKGKRVLIIDDVMTTGASLAAAAKALKKMGAKEVHGLVYAQKL